MKRRAGTKQAELLSKKWPIIRKATAKAQAAGLVLCRYIEFDEVKLHSEDFLSVTHSEEIDCILYEPSPKSIDTEKYYQADKIIGFPWCDISKNPIINAIFQETKSGHKWIITAILSDDPIKAFAQCACTRWYNYTQIAVSGGFSATTGTVVNVNIFEDDQVFWSKTTTGATEQNLLNGYTEVQQSVLGPKLDDLKARADQRARFVYSASIQTQATGVSGGQITFQLQRSLELDGQPEVWSDVEGAIAEQSLELFAKDDRLTFSFVDTLETGVPFGIALKYQLLAKRSDVSHGAKLHVGNVSPTVYIDGQFNYPLAEEVPGQVLAGTGVSATVNGEAGVEGFVDSGTGTTTTVSGEAGAEGLVLANTGTSASFTTWIAENIYSAPPSTPPANELGLTFEEVEGTTVTIPATQAGYPSVRFSYNAAIQLLAIGGGGGLCTFQLQESVNGGAWTDVTGETATKSFAAQNQEERFTFTLYAPYPTGINGNEAVQLRVVGKTDLNGRQVEVHSSLIDPANTAPTVFAEADYFFT